MFWLVGKNVLGHLAVKTSWWKGVCEYTLLFIVVSSSIRLFNRHKCSSLFWLFLDATVFSFDQLAWREFVNPQETKCRECVEEPRTRFKHRPGVIISNERIAVRFPLIFFRTVQINGWKTAKVPRLPLQVGPSRNGRACPANSERFSAITTDRPRISPTHNQTVAVCIFYDPLGVCPARFGGIAFGRAPIYVLFGPVFCERPHPLLCFFDGVHCPECGNSVPARGHGPGAGGSWGAVRPGFRTVRHRPRAGCVWGIPGMKRWDWGSKDMGKRASQWMLVQADPYRDVILKK